MQPSFTILLLRHFWTATATCLPRISTIAQKYAAESDYRGCCQHLHCFSCARLHGLHRSETAENHGCLGPRLRPFITSMVLVRISEERAAIGVTGSPPLCAHPAAVGEAWLCRSGPGLQWLLKRGSRVVSRDPVWDYKGPKLRSATVGRGCLPPTFRVCHIGDREVWPWSLSTSGGSGCICGAPQETPATSLGQIELKLQRQLDCGSREACLRSPGME
ncbi:hypothetical protein NDU88_005840 [Pleurodeles waltl]|uniref:Secreted protein n=1 Tax=Pleurodeles waltl TaxID=8319 RepID=A0AAV7NWE8_PLEWA|nr:hypothetical protein NDU88_005840 [Pleurodeles waltl]